MKKDEFVSVLMDKLSGELSENEAQRFEEEVAKDDALQEEYSFFSQAWDDMGAFDTPEPSDSLSTEFYQQLAAYEQQEQKTLAARWQSFKERVLALPSMVQTTSVGMCLLLIGFILGGQFNSSKSVETVESSNNLAETSDDYVLSTQKIQEINSLQASSDAEEETVERLKHIIQNEENTNVRLAALNQLSKNYSDHPSLKRFYSYQLEREQSPLIQVELLNAYIENSQTKESIHTMETMLSNRKLNPIVQEKIRKDLPVLRASYVQ